MASDVQMDVDMLNLEQVVVGDGVMDAGEDIKTEIKPPPSIQTYQHDSLQCFQCFITFCNSKAKERHMRKSHREEYKQQLQQTDTLFTCYVCDRTFPSSEELTQHQASHSTEDKPFRCPHCKGSFRTFSELTDHRRNLCAERHCVCKDCGILFRGPAKLRTHRLAHHSQPVDEQAEADDETKTYRCAKCQRGFQTEAELVQHQENHAGDENCNGKPPVKKRGRPPKKANVAATVSEPENSEKKEEEAKENSGEEEIKEEEAAGEKKPAEPKEGKRRGRPPKQQEEVQIPCPIADCKLTFSSLSSLRSHKKEMHGRPPPPRKPHACTECTESYAQPEQLQAHMARAHGSNRHTCPTCGKSFGRESNLKAHQKTHSDGEGAKG
ncbi:zinc finger protein 576.2 [Denticeps clupeoides]|uniref:zinc finger protein 576.2 n=1 Tax=Denticeps clupeoides TaxID=299321 RepID=UPI0010A2F561|nr:zinc finger protein 43-like [Denticeps clupeoides]